MVTSLSAAALRAPLRFSAALEGAGTGRRNALVLANRLPYPLDDGWKLRTYHIVRALARRADTTLLTFHRDDERRQVEEFRRSLDAPVEVISVPPPRSYSFTRVLLGLVSSTPIYVWNNRSRHFKRELDHLLRRRRYTVVVAELTAMYPYLSAIAADTLRVVDTHNVDSLLLRRYSRQMQSTVRRYYARHTARKLERFESQVYRDACVTWVCSEEERRHIEGTVESSNTWVVPNGVDIERLRPPVENRITRGRLVFCGRMDYYPNTDAVAHFAEAVLPQLRQIDCSTEFWAVGQAVPPRLRELADRTPGLRLTGRVDDVRPFLAEAEVIVVPLRVGGGTRLKILEAMAMARPIVSSTVGAEGLEIEPGRDLLLADGPAAFVTAVRSLQENRAYAEQLGKRARETVCRTYAWDRIEEPLFASLGWGNGAREERSTV